MLTDGMGGSHKQLRRRPLGPVAALLATAVQGAARELVAQNVKKLSLYGMQPRMIMDYLQIPIGEFTNHYRRAFDEGQAEAHGKVAARIFHDACFTPGMVGLEAAKFWMKNRANWNDKQDVNLRGVIGVFDGRADSQRDLVEQSTDVLVRLLEFRRTSGDRSALEAHPVGPTSWTADGSLSDEG